jgi:SH3-like domain-containing protein
MAGFKSIFLCIAVFYLFVNAQETVEPSIYFCIKPTVKLHKKPQANAPLTGDEVFGKPVVVMARHNEWLGVYKENGVKGWVKKSDILNKNEFAARYSHLPLNEVYLIQFLDNTVRGLSKRRFEMAPLKEGAPEKDKGKGEFVKNTGETAEVYVLRDNVKIRSRPTPNSRVLRSTFRGEAFRVVNMMRSRYMVEYEDKRYGWISEQLARPEIIEYKISRYNDWGTPKESYAYIRSNPTRKGNIIGTAKEGFRFEILDKKDKWYKVRLDASRFGWILMSNFRIIRKADPREIPAIPEKDSKITAIETRPAEPKKKADAQVQAVAAPAPPPPPPPPPAAPPPPAPKPVVEPPKKETVPAPAPPPPPQAEPQTQPAFLKFVSSYNLRVRNGPSTKKKVIGNVDFGDCHEIKKLKNGWCSLVLENGATGYTLSKFFASAQDIFNILDKARRAAKQRVNGVAVPGIPLVSLHKGPHGRFQRIYLVEPNDTLFVVGRFGPWRRVFVASGGIGWAYAPFLRPLAAMTKRYKKKRLPNGRYSKTRSGQAVLDNYTREAFVKSLSYKSVQEHKHRTSKDSALVRYYLAEQKKIKADISTIVNKKKAALNAEREKINGINKKLQAARQDSLATGKKIESMRKTGMARLDSQRVSMNNRFSAQRDSLKKKKEEFLKLKENVKAIDDLKKQKEALGAEIKKLKKAAEEARKRAANLKEIAKYEFDVDASPRAKDSILAYAKQCDSLAVVKEAALKQAAQDIKKFSGTKPKEIPIIIARIDSTGKALTAVQKQQFGALIQEQKKFEKDLGVKQGKLIATIKADLGKIYQELENQKKAVAQIQLQIKNPGKILEEKSNELKAQIISKKMF